MKIKGMDITLTKDGAYRPDTLVINGETASMTRFLDAHGYNWKSSASGNILCYQTEGGTEYRVYQSDLMKGERMTSESARAAKARYDAKTAKYISLKLNRNTDGDLINHLEQQENIQGYLKNLIREDMKNERRNEK